MDVNYDLLIILYYYYNNFRQDQAVFTVLFYQYSKKYNFDTSLYDHIGYTIHNDVD